MKRPFFSLAITSANQIDLLFDKRLTEKEKDRGLISNLKYLILYLLLCFVIAYLLTFLAWLCLEEIANFLEIEELDSSSLYFYSSLTIGSLSLFLLRDKNSDYGYWSRLIHKLILQNYNLARYLFNWQKKKLNDQGNNNQKFLLISGLARSGTTALTKQLYSSNKFYATTYDRMPFLMAPKILPKAKLPEKEKERAHRDQLKVSSTSIEALDEYFFKVFLNDSFVKSNQLFLHEIDVKLNEAYMQFQSFYRNSPQQQMYLSKNNNMLLRYKSMRNLNPNFVAVFLFREPLEHAYSLMKQNQNFRKLQEKDSFVLDYMNLIGHHEFGENIKSFAFESAQKNPYDQGSINFYLKSWIDYYSYLLSLPKEKQTVLIDHADLAKNPERVINEISKFCGFDMDVDYLSYKKPERPSQEALNPDVDLMSTAEKIYESLNQLKA